jgi:hypothetical protein
MPDFTGKLTEADVVKITAFIQGTVWRHQAEQQVAGPGQVGHRDAHGLHAADRAQF